MQVVELLSTRGWCLNRLWISMLNNVKLENTSDNRDNPVTLAAVTVRRVTMMKLPPLSHCRIQLTVFPWAEILSSQTTLLIVNTECWMRRGTLCGLFGSLHIAHVLRFNCLIWSSGQPFNNQQHWKRRESNSNERTIFPYVCRRPDSSFTLQPDLPQADVSEPWMKISRNLAWLFGTCAPHQ